MRRCKLGEIADICLGKMLDKEKNKGNYQPYLANINVRWGSFDLQNLSLMRFETTEQERYGLKYGDIVMCEGGEPGRCAIWRDELPNMKIQKALHRIRVHSDIDSRYIYYWFLLAGRNHLLDGSFIETTIKHLTGDRLKLIELELPSNSKQKQISDVLEKLDEKIALNNRVNATLEAMAKTLYDYWFVQFDFPDEKGRPYKTSGGKMVYNEELGREVPAGWEVKRLLDIATLFDSERIPLSSKEREIKKGTIPYYGATGILDYVDEAIFDGVYLLIAEDGSVEMPNGNLVLQYIWGKAWVNNHAHILQGIPPYSTEYLFLALRHTKTRQSMTGSIQKKVTQDNLKNIKLVCPSNPNIFILFQKYISTFFDMYKRCCEENRRLAALRDWLLPMLMNGQVGFRKGF